MIEPSHEVMALRDLLERGEWMPTAQERAAARKLLEQPLSAETIRLAIADEAEGVLSTALEPVAMVLGLPQIHEDPETRLDLIRATLGLLQRVNEA